MRISVPITLGRIQALIDAAIARGECLHSSIKEEFTRPVCNDCGKVLAHAVNLLDVLS